MANGKTVSLQVVLKKVEELEARVKMMEKQRSVEIVRLSDKEMAEIRKIKKEMESGKEYSSKDVFGE